MPTSHHVAEQLADLIDHAKTMPLFRGQIRVDKQQVYQLVDELRSALRSERSAGVLDDRTAFVLLAAADDLREVVSKAYPVPLTDQVRLHANKAAEPSAALRNPGVG